MDFMKLLWIVVSILCCSCYASELFSGQLICLRGTERPCYRIVYIPDGSRRLTFAQASRACRTEGGELLSVETESEQLLIVQFIQQLPAAEGYFWIGLRRNHEDQGLGSDCGADYRWLDGSQATFRNWLLGEPSCGQQACVLMQLSPSPPRGGWRFDRLPWANGDCSSRNHFICKYPKENPQKTLKAEEERITEAPAMTVLPNNPLVTINTAELEVASESAGLGTDLTYIIWPSVGLLMFLVVGSGVISFRFLTAGRKAQAYRASQGSFDARSPGTRSHSEGHSVTQQVSPSCPLPQPLPNDYENLPARNIESGFVTNDIYEACLGHGQPSSGTGWVENEIYG
nr:layilin-like [Paramormyrops kingsleyae]